MMSRGCHAPTDAVPPAAPPSAVPRPAHTPHRRCDERRDQAGKLSEFVLLEHLEALVGRLPDLFGIVIEQFLENTLTPVPVAGTGDVGGDSCRRLVCRLPTKKATVCPFFCGMIA